MRVLSQVGHFLQKKKGYKIKVFNSIDFRKSMHYNPMAYIKTESDVLKFVNALITKYKGRRQGGGRVLDKSGNAFYIVPSLPISSLKGQRKNGT